MKLHGLPQMKSIGLAVLADLPAMCQIGNDRLAPVARIAPDQIVEHAALCADVVDCRSLVDIEMRRPHRDAVSQDTAALRVRLRGLEPKTRAVEFIGNFGSENRPTGQPPQSCCRATLKDLAAVP